MKFDIEEESNSALEAPVFEFLDSLDFQKLEEATAIVKTFSDGLYSEGTTDGLDYVVNTLTRLLKELKRMK